MQFIKLDAPGWEQKPLTPRSDRHWYQTYQKVVAQSKAEVANDEQILKATMDEIHNRRKEHTSKQVEGKYMPRLPKLDGMQYLRSEKPRKRAPVPEPKSKLVFSAGSRTKTLTGRGVLSKARKEAQEGSLFRNRLAVPSHMLHEMASPVQHISYSLAAEYSRPVAAQPIDPTIKPAEVFVPKRKRDAGQEAGRSEPSSTNDPERRIKKLKTTMATNAASSDTAKEASNVVNTPPPPPPAGLNKAPRTQPPSQVASRTVRPPMKAKRPVDIFLPPKRR